MAGSIDAAMGGAWSQLPLFETRVSIASADGRPVREPGAGARRISYTRVTRDPAVALSSAANQGHANELRGSLHSFVGGLDPVRRAELRARLGLTARSELLSSRLRRVG